MSSQEFIKNTIKTTYLCHHSAQFTYSVDDESSENFFLLDDYIIIFNLDFYLIFCILAPLLSCNMMFNGRNHIILHFANILESIIIEINAFYDKQIYFSKWIQTKLIVIFCIIIAHYLIYFLPVTKMYHVLQKFAFNINKNELKLS